MKAKFPTRIYLLFLPIFLVFNCFTFAQTPCTNPTYCTDAGGENACKILSTVYDKKLQRIEIGLGKSITYQDLNNALSPQSWVIVDITESTPGNSLYLIQPPQRGDRRQANDPEPFINLLLYLSQPLKPGHEYRIFQSKLTFQGCSPKKVLEAAYKEESNTSSVPTPPSNAPKKNYFPKSAAKGREDSNVYLSGAIEGARKNKTQFSADIKIDQPFGGYGFFSEIGPVFNLKASSADEADANSINFAVKLRHAFVISRKFDTQTRQFVEKDKRLLTGIVLDFLPGFETERRVKNVNALLGTRLTFVPRTLGGANPIYLQPFIGYEIGTNLKSQVARAENRTISRGLVGGSLYIDFPRQFKGLSFQTDYVRRFLINREIRFEVDKDKKLVPLNLGRGPRDYLKTGFTFNFSDFAGATLNYEYGSLPPNFQLVDSKFSFGLVYKFKTTYPSK